MGWIEWAVLGTSVLATAWLLYYTRIYLPNAMHERFRDSMQAFSTAVELRFPTHVGLTARVHALAIAVGKELNLGNSQLRDLAMAARLRDIGLCAIPYRLVNGRSVPDWSEAELRTYNQHAKVGGAMLDLVPSLRRLAPIVRNHHAHFDGSGEDDTGIELPLPIEALVLKVVSEYVWMERWQGALISRQTVNEGSGTVFAPRVVDALWNVLPSTRVADSRQSVAQS